MFKCFSQVKKFIAFFKNSKHWIKAALESREGSFAIDIWLYGYDNSVFASSLLTSERLGKKSLVLPSVDLLGKEVRSGAFHTLERLTGPDLFNIE